jgi:pyruvate dehydrogenase E1 component alpha subunit
MAMLWKLPAIFVVENNGYAMGTSVERTANHTDIWKLGLGYEMPCGPVDGMNPVKVAEAMHEAIERARRGDGPTFLEMKTYRYRGHSMSDAQLYRSKEEVEEYKKIDPITQILDVIKDQKYATEEEIEIIDEKVKNLVEECVAFAEESPFPEIQQLYDVVYEEENYPVADIYGVELLKVLMTELNLQPKDLMPIFADETIISDILSEEQPLTIEQIEKLSNFFYVSPSVFLKNV